MLSLKVMIALLSSTINTTKAAFSKSVICTSQGRNSTRHPMSEFTGGILKRMCCQLVLWIFWKWIFLGVRKWIFLGFTMEKKSELINYLPLLWVLIHRRGRGARDQSYPLTIWKEVATESRMKLWKSTYVPFHSYSYFIVFHRWFDNCGNTLLLEWTPGTVNTTKIRQPRLAKHPQLPPADGRA